MPYSVWLRVNAGDCCNAIPSMVAIEPATLSMPFVSNADAQSIATLPRPAGRSELRQAVKIQRLLMIDMESGETLPPARAQLARAWDAISERIRILRGLGAPKAVPATNDPAATPRRRPGRASVTPAIPGQQSSDAPLD